MNSITRKRARIGVAFAVALLAALTISIAIRAADDAPPANVAGSWALTVGDGAFTATLVLQQDGGTITGTQKSDFGDSPLTGTVKGQVIHFTVNINSPNGAFTVVHDGTVDGDSMKGTFQMSDGSGNSGSWTAARQTQK
jgi:hypothetical protein